MDGESILQDCFISSCDRFPPGMLLWSSAIDFSKLPCRSAMPRLFTITSKGSIWTRRPIANVRALRFSQWWLSPPAVGLQRRCWSGSSWHAWSPSAQERQLPKSRRGTSKGCRSRSGRPVPTRSSGERRAARTPRYERRQLRPRWRCRRSVLTSYFFLLMRCADVYRL